MFPSGGGAKINGTVINNATVLPVETNGIQAGDFVKKYMNETFEGPELVLTTNNVSYGPWYICTNDRIVACVSENSQTQLLLLSVNSSNGTVSILDRKNLKNKIMWRLNMREVSSGLIVLEFRYYNESQAYVQAVKVGTSALTVGNEYALVNTSGSRDNLDTARLYNNTFVTVRLYNDSYENAPYCSIFEVNNDLTINVIKTNVGLNFSRSYSYFTKLTTVKRSSSYAEVILSTYNGDYVIHVDSNNNITSNGTSYGFQKADSNTPSNHLYLLDGACNPHGYYMAKSVGFYYKVFHCAFSITDGAINYGSGLNETDIVLNNSCSIKPVMPIPKSFSSIELLCNGFTHFVSTDNCNVADRWYTPIDTHIFCNNTNVFLTIGSGKTIAKIIRYYNHSTIKVYKSDDGLADGIAKTSANANGSIEVVFPNQVTDSYKFGHLKSSTEPITITTGFKPKIIVVWKSAGHWQNNSNTFDFILYNEYMKLVDGCIGSYVLNNSEGNDSFSITKGVTHTFITILDNGFTINLNSNSALSDSNYYLAIK